MLKGYGLTTDEMVYHMPDYPHVLNSFIWKEEIESPLHSARSTHRKMIRAGEWRNVVGEFTVH